MKNSYTSKELQEAIAVVLQEKGEYPLLALTVEVQAKVKILFSKIKGTKDHSRPQPTQNEVKREADFMSDPDKRFVERRIDSYNDFHYRLMDKGRRKYLGTFVEKLQVFWEKHWLTVLGFIANTVLAWLLAIYS